MADKGKTMVEGVPVVHVDLEDLHPVNQAEKRAVQAVCDSTNAKQAARRASLR